MCKHTEDIFRIKISVAFKRRQRELKGPLQSLKYTQEKGKMLKKGSLKSNLIVGLGKLVVSKRTIKDRKSFKIVDSLAT